MSAPHAHTRSILLIEDDPAIGELLDEYLSEEGYAITVTTSAPLGLAALADRHFDLVLTDAFTEQRSPTERWAQIEEIREVAAGIPIIICTAHHARDFDDYAARGFSALVTKPFDLSDLLHLIEQLFARPTRSEGMTG